MKTKILSLTLLLAFLAFGVRAQKINTVVASKSCIHFYTASKPGIPHPVKEVSTSQTLRVGPGKVALPNISSANINPVEEVAKYISPLGFLQKTTGTPGNMIYNTSSNKVRGKY